MTSTEIAHMHEDLEILKRDIAVIKHILSQEGSLTPEAKKRLEKARQSPKSSYVKL